MEYIGNHIYEDGALKQTLIEGGYLTYSGNTPAYHFYVKDHLGNNRMVMSASGAVEQVVHYYPYGMAFADGTNADAQRFKYNGKELDAEDGLNWMDYGARMYDASLARWNKVDRYSEKYYSMSGYSYCGGEPIGRVDINGDSIDVEIKFNHIEEGTFSGHTAYGNMIVTDYDSNESITTEVYSGGIPKGNPIPEGTYDILQKNEKGFYRLEAKDDNYGDDETNFVGINGDSSTRTFLRLHRESNTIGCVAVKGDKKWREVESLIDQTTSSMVQVKKERVQYKIARFLMGNPFILQQEKEEIKKLGTLRVTYTNHE